MSELPQICFSVKAYSCDVERLAEDGKSIVYNGIVWDVEEGEPSTVSVNGENQCDTNLRKSTTIRDKFVYKDEWKLRKFFKDLKIGLGTKHIYENGEFMREHYDSKKPDLDGLPHIMTLIITTDAKSLRVCGKEISFSGEKHGWDPVTAVIFTLNCPHEVLPYEATLNKITGRLTPRISIVFPVYGIWRGSNAKPRRTAGVSCHDEILRALEDETDARRIEGWVKDLGIDKLNRLATLLKNIEEQSSDDESDEETDNESDDETKSISSSNASVNVSVITYTDESGNEITCPVSKELVIPFAKNLTFKTFSEREIVIEKMKSLVRKDKKYLENEFKKFMNLEAPPVDAKTVIPSHPFTVSLRGRYLNGATVEDLVGVDAEVYKFLVSKNRQVSFVPNTMMYDCQLVYNYQRGTSFEGFYEGEGCNKYDILSVSSAGVEFDDSSEYDLHYSRIKGVLTVN